MSEYFNPIYSTDNIWRGQNSEQCLTDDLDSIKSDITTLQTGKANSNHTHSQVSSASTTQVVYRVWSPYSTTISGCVVSIHIIGR